MNNPRLELFKQAEILASDTELVVSIEHPDPYFNENQGGCSDGRYYYQTFMHRDCLNGEVNNECHIAKIDITTGQIVQMSEKFNTLNHSNDLVYNPNKGYIAIVHNNPNKNRITLIDPETLKAIGNVELHTNVYSIDYSPKRDRYVVGLSGGQNLMFLDGDFKPIDGVVHKATEKTVGYVTQGICSDEDLIYCVLFDAKGYRAKDIHNLATVYDWNGDYVGIIEFDTGMSEPENLSIINNELYIASCLRNFDLYKVTPKLK